MLAVGTGATPNKEVTMLIIEQYSGYKPDFISHNAMSDMKREAKSRVKNHNIKLHEALELIAEEVGFSNWHQLTIQRKRDAEVENYLHNRCVVAFDEKDAPGSIEILNGLLTEDYLMPFACDKEFVFGYVNKHHLNGEYTRPPAKWRDDTPDVLDSAIEAGEIMLSLAWYRFNQDLKLNDKPIDVLNRIKPHTFFPPQYVALRGIFYGVHDERGMFAW